MHLNSKPFYFYLSMVCLAMQMGCTEDSGHSQPDSSTACTWEGAKCLGGMLRICHAGVSTLYACPYGCDQGACLKPQPSVPTGCTANRCQDASSLWVCDATTGKQTLVPCAYGCDSALNACKYAPTPTCTYEGTQCSSDGSSVLRCDAGTEVSIPCEYGCVSGVCQTQPDTGCNYEGTRCSEDGSSVLRCDSGTEVSMPCEHGCVSGVCQTQPEPDTGCNYAGTQCSEDGKYVVYCKDGEEQKVFCGYADGWTAQRCEDGTCIQTCQFSGTQCAPNGLPRLMRCEDGYPVMIACAYGCASGACQDVSQLPSTCEPGSKPKCLDERTAMSCESYDDGYSWSPIIQHCGSHRVCADGQCIIQQEAYCSMSTCYAACGATSCMDLKTLLLCSDGFSQGGEVSGAKYADGLLMPCQPDELCIHDACVPAGDIKACASNTDCGRDEVCHQSICYTKSNMEIPVGSPCDAGTFEEYCIGDTEYWCDYDGVVATNDCSEYNGCSLYIKPRYPNKKPIRNAICRGESKKLVECEGRDGIKFPGPVNYHCLNVEDEYMSFYYSLADACVVGTDGRMIYLYDRDEYQCKTPCDENTGFCKD